MGFNPVHWETPIERIAKVLNLICAVLIRGKDIESEVPEPEIPLLVESSRIHKVAVMKKMQLTVRQLIYCKKLK